MFREQSGQSVCLQVMTFKLVTGIAHNGSKEKVVMASVGLSFSAVLTESDRGNALLVVSGRFTFGSAEKG